MSDEDIISALVKGRERFRQLLQLYQQQRAAPGEVRPAGKGPAVGVLKESENLLTVALAHLKSLPEKPSQACAQSDNRQYAAQLLKEIGELLERVVVMDREMRRTPPSSPAVPLFGAARDKAMRQYAVV
ncbi:MAG: hypothetical protein HY343_03205 [Lentisphaerae bacterium]|nr:hypothetical protein [Lentisphaerota bacterium]